MFAGELLTTPRNPIVTVAIVVSAGAGIYFLGKYVILGIAANPVQDQLNFLQG